MAAGAYARRMKAKSVVWLVVCGGLILMLNATGLPGWYVGVVLVAVLDRAVPLGVKRYRLERRLARTFWGPWDCAALHGQRWIPRRMTP
jgi:hypothetical protein